MLGLHERRLLLWFRLSKVSTRGRARVRAASLFGIHRPSRSRWPPPPSESGIWDGLMTPSPTSPFASGEISMRCLPSSQPPSPKSLVTSNYPLPRNGRRKRRRSRLAACARGRAHCRASRTIARMQPSRTKLDTHGSNYSVSPPNAEARGKQTVGINSKKQKHRTTC